MRESAWYMTISLVETLLVSVHPHWVSAIHAVVSSPLSPSSHSSLPLRSLLPLIIPLLQGSSNLIPEPHSKSTQINQFLGAPTRGLGKSCACLETIISELPPPFLSFPVASGTSLEFWNWLKSNVRDRISGERSDISSPSLVTFPKLLPMAISSTLVDWMGDSGFPWAKG